MADDYILDDTPRGRQLQRGSGAYTLCGKCNNDTGAWYGNAYLDWAWQGMRFAHFANRAPSIYFTFQIFPLRVVKQIVCMLFSTTHDTFHRAQPELQRFVLDKKRRLLDPSLRIFAYYSLSSRMRSTGLVAKVSFEQGVGTGLYSEISFPPWGYLFCLDSPPADKRLVDISFFSRFRYNDWKEISLRIPMLPVETWIPGDYRSRSEVIEQVQASKDGHSESGANGNENSS